MKKELLAPAGDIEAGYAALYYGADAVYLGLQQFSARANAVNFDEPALGEFVAYAHSLKKKVFAAVNTLVQESELEDLLATLDICTRTQVDAVIIQDLGVARIVRKQYPQLEMHASTQMAVHNREGAVALQKLGFKRVVVARELTLPEIKNIASIPGLETEAFIHGALCYSYSGLCMFSSMAGGKSANRGKCLYPCRAEFRDEQGRSKHFFSMKDMALEEDVLKMPVLSLKIEGRKKNALYVAAVTDYYRRILDGGKKDIVRAQNIQQIFSRPWCKFHFNGRDKNIIDRDFVGHRGLLIGTLDKGGTRSIVFKTSHLIEKHDGIQIDVPGCEKPFGFSVLNMRVGGRSVYEAKPNELVEIALPPHDYKLEKGLKVYLASASNVKGSYPYSKPKPREFRPLQEISVRVVVEPERITAESCGCRAEICGVFEPAKDTAKIQEAVEKAFAKTGDTCFALNKLEVVNEQGLFAPASLLNELRRNLYAQIKPETISGKLPAVGAGRQDAKGLWIIKTDQPQILKNIDMSEVDEAVILLAEDSDSGDWAFIPKNKIRLALPAVCRNVAKFKEKTGELLAQGYKKWEIANYWGLGVLPQDGIDLSFDYEIYMFNTQAAALAAEAGAGRVTLSPEDMPENWRVLADRSPVPVVLPVYEDIALFTSAACIRDNACKDCDRRKKRIVLRRGVEEYEAISENCQTVLVNKKAWYAGNAAAAVKADFYRVSFLHKEYTAEQTEKIWRQARNFCVLANTYDGNSERKI